MRSTLISNDDLFDDIELFQPSLNLFRAYPSTLWIWRLKLYLRKRFPLHRGIEHDWLGMFAWCVTDGRAHYRILQEIRGMEEFLCREAVLPKLPGEEWEGQISLAMLCCGMARYRWSLAPMLASKLARRRAARAFWRGQRHECNLPTAEWQMERALGPEGNLRGFIDRLYLPDHDKGLDEEGLIEKFGLSDLVEFAGERKSRCGGVAKPALWIPRYATSRLPSLVPRRVWNLMVDTATWIRQGPNEAQMASVMRRVSTDYALKKCAPCLPFGVNLFGYARGELGIGEDIRQVADALIKQDIPVCLVNFEPGKNVSQADMSADHLLSEAPRYAINLFCMTGIETVRYACERGMEAFRGRYNIGLWPWELPDWPESCRHAYGCVDEIWGISAHAAGAHRFAAPRPVFPMSLPVALGEVGEQKRRDFGLPEGAYLYVFAFDINSSSVRKNPEALIAAFQKAYPIGSADSVGLVLKISHWETGCPLWERIRKAAVRDARIHIVEKTMRRPELLALLNACDCFVSLHRAEGFGRCLAEALLLGKQLVATGWSGNLDFCQEPRVALVRHRMVQLKPGDYMWGEGQSWADPEIGHAAELLRSVRANPRVTEGDDFPFLPEKVGKRFACRLHELWDRLQNA
jgi:hypothetical protein